MRRGEILALRWRDVDLDNNSISVSQSLEQTRAGLRFKAPKTKRSRRTVVLSAVATDCLREHRKSQAETRLALGMGRPELVFATPDGEPWPPDALSRQFGLLVRRLKLRPVTFHGLRHTHITNLLKAGVHPKVAADRAGHSSVSTTLDIYSHAVPSLQEDAARKVDIALRSALQGRASSTSVANGWQSDPDKSG